MACCDDVKNLLNEILALIAKIDGRVTALEGRMSLAETTIQDLINIIFPWRKILTPVIPYSEFTDPIIAYWLDQTKLHAEYRLPLLDRVATAMRETGKSNRWIIVSILSDGLGKWLTDVIVSALTQIPKEWSVDPEEPSPLGPQPHFITTLDFFGGRSTVIADLTQSEGMIQGGTDSAGGGTAAYGASIGEIGKGLGDAIFGTGLGIGEGIAKGLKNLIKPPAIEEFKEKDPVWAPFRKAVFGIGSLPADFPEDLLAEAIAGSTVTNEPEEKA